MVGEMKVKCPRVNLFVLCFEQGKFDASMQSMMKTYNRFISDDTKIWNNMIAVVTKVSYGSDYEDINNWKEDME